ncbi:MAG TPA: TerB family tellurite resistance protein [Woeseiaceae bacterium]|nr:TerB family tellurite resistance protein [Woeseiaceae bacterium]
MHIVLGILSAVISILYILDRLGIDVAFNPWSWRRRRAWAKRYTGDPIYSVDEPMHAAAIFVTATAKFDGTVSTEEKQAILQMFEEKFSLSPKAAAELFGSATHLLGAPQVMGTQVEGLAGKSRDLFSPEQAESMLEMMEGVAALSGGPTPQQHEYLVRMRNAFEKPQPAGTWA